MDSAHWSATDYAWDPYRLLAVEDGSAASLHALTQHAGSEPDSLVPPVLPGPALPSAAASRVSKAVCKVEGCERLLRDEKPYYQRFLVCEEHMRCLSLDINGQLSRFCQQCGKFEPLEAFDNNKRSCRARLQEHNKRRRKVGVSSRSNRKHRRDTGLASKAPRDGAVAAAPEGDALPSEQQDHAADEAAASADADDALMTAAPSAATPDGSSDAVLPASWHSAGAPTQPGSTAGAAAAVAAVGPCTPPAAAVSAGAAASTGCHAEPASWQQGPTAVEEQPPAATASMEIDAGEAPLLPAADTAESLGWSLLTDLLAQPAAADQQQQWGECEPGAQVGPAFPFHGDLMFADASAAPPVDAAAAAAAQANAVGAQPVSYNSSLLYQPARLNTEAVPIGQVSGDSSSARQLTGSQQVPAAFLKLEQHDQQQQQQQHGTVVPLQAYGSSLGRHRKGSSCSSSSAATPDGCTQAVLGANAPGAQLAATGAGAAAAAAPCVQVAAAAAASGIEQAAPVCTERDMQLLKELLAESADFVGNALQMGIDGPAVAPMQQQQQPGRMKRHRSSTPQPDLLQQHTQQMGTTSELLSAAACAEHAARLPSVNLPPIVHRDDSAEEQQLFTNNSHSSSSDDSKRLKHRPSTKGSSSHRASTQDCVSAQLLQQQEQYQQLQAVQQQLQQSFTVAPVQQQQQQHYQQQQVDTVSAAATAAAAALKHIQQHELTFDQQLEAVMQRAGLSTQAQQQAPMSNALCAAQAGNSFWGLAGQPMPMQHTGYNASDLQQQQQMEQYNSQYMACYGMQVGSSNEICGGSQWPTMSVTGSHIQLLQQQQQQAAAAQQALSAALAVAQGGRANAAYRPVDSSLRISLKLHNTEPHQLQPEMLPRLNALLGSSSSGSGAADVWGAPGPPGMSVECGYMRPGCVHLVLQLRSAADLQAAAAALAAAGQGLDASSWTWALLGRTLERSSIASMHDAQQQQQQPASITVQLGTHSVVLLRDGKLDPAGAAALQQLLQHGRLPAGAAGRASQPTLPTGQQQQAAAPRLDAVLPCCISSNSDGVAGGRCQLLALGSGLSHVAAGAGDDTKDTSCPVLLARCQGMFLAAEATAAAPLQAEAMLQLLQHAQHSRQAGSSSSSRPAEQCMTVTLQGLQPSGLVHLEFMQGLLLSESRPLLVVDDDAVAAELQGLQAACMAGQQRQLAAEQVLVDFGRLLDFRAAARRHAASRGQQAAASDDGSSTSEQQQQQQQLLASIRRSISAPLPDVIQQGAAPQLGDSPPVSCSGPCLPSSSLQQPAAPATPQAVSTAAGPPPHLDTCSRGSSSTSSSSMSFRTSLRNLLGRRSFALESLPQPGSDQDPVPTVGPRREASVPCFPVGLHRTSFSFHRRNSIDAAASVPSQQQSQGGANPRGGAVTAIAPSLPPSGRHTDGSGNSGSGNSGSGSSSFGRWRHHGEQQPPVARHASAPPTCGSPLQDVQPSAACLSEAALAQRRQQLLQLQQQQAARGGQDGPAVEDPDQADQSSKEGDSVSSFVKLSPGAGAGAAAAARQHPLLTLEYKGLMMDVGVRLLCYLLDRGWPASARMVLTTLLDCAAPVASFQAIASAVAACNGERLGLLHRAVRSGQVATVVEVLGWAVQQQVCLSWAAKGPGSLTPLHLLALGKDQGSARASVDGPGLQQSLAGVILQQLPDLSSLWFSITDDAGMTPAQYSSSVCGERVNQVASSSLLLRAGHVVNAISQPATMLPTPADRLGEWQGQPGSVPSADDSAHGLERHVVAAAPVAAARLPEAVAAAAVAAAVAAAAAPAAVAAAAPAAAPAAAAAAAPAAVQLQRAGPKAVHAGPAADSEGLSVGQTALESAGVPIERRPSASAAEMAETNAAVARVGCMCWKVPAACAHICEHEQRATAEACDSNSTEGALTGPPAESASTYDVDDGVLPVSVRAVPQPAATCSSASSSSRTNSTTAQCADVAKAHKQGSSCADTMASAQQPSAMIYGLARLLSVCQQGLEGFPESLVGLRVVLQGLRVLWVLLLLESVLHGSLGLMLASVIGMTACTLLLRLLGVLVQPHLHRSLTDASELQRQLQLLVSCICRSLPLPHSRLLLTFDDPCLEEQYTQVLAESRQQTDAAIAASIKGLIAILPIVVRCGCCQYLTLLLLSTPQRHWDLPSSHLLAAAVAAGLPLIVALSHPFSYNSMRDSVLAAMQGLVLVMLGKPLLAAGAASAAVGHGYAMVAHVQLLQGCVAALLLLLCRQRLCWATWQAVCDAALGLGLLCWQGGPLLWSMPSWSSCLWSVLHALVPVLVLPLLYVREKVDRQMALAPIMARKQVKSSKLKEA